MQLQVEMPHLSALRLIPVPKTCDVSIFLDLSLHCYMNIQAGTLMGEVEVERWDEVTLAQGDVLVLVSKPWRHASPPPPCVAVRAVLFCQWTLMWQHLAQHHPP